MRSFGKFALAAAGMMFLAACGTIDGDAVANMENKGKAFEKGLQAGYVKIGKLEAAEYDWADASHFYDKALAAAMGGPVAPDTIDSRDLPAGSVSELSAARTRLMNALNAGGGEKNPAAAAHAQVMFDCWMQEQEENNQPDDIAKCRAAFMTAMDLVEASLKPKAKAMAKPKPAPAPKPIVDGIYIVFFDFDDDRPNMASGKSILQALTDYGIDKPDSVSVVGHTDTAGSNKYNNELSKRRAQVVRQMLIDGGMDAKKVSMGFAGEGKPLRPTEDGVREPRNRRVEITFE